MGKQTKKKLTKEQKIRRKRINKILQISGLIMSAIQLVISVIFMIMLQFVDILPLKYKALIGFLLILFCVITLLTQRWKKPGIVTKIMAFFLCIILIVGCVYINSTYKAIGKIAGNNTKTTVVGVYVLKDNPANEITDLAADTSFGKMVKVDEDNTSKTIDEINKKLNSSINCNDYETLTAMVDALYSGDAEAIILNQSYTGVLAEMDGYIDFEDKTKCIMTYEYETEIEQNKNDNNYLTGDDVFTIYISGVDINGSPAENRNSDVNILCTVNKETHQILMINTPRDFLVPLSISNGVKDKLTHAGCYGIDCSVDTLEMLYGINIDYYLKVNFTGFIDIINKLGGVEVDSEFDFTTYHGKYHVNKGINHMDGDAALGFARERYAFGAGDRQRGKNQMRVIKAVINKMVSSDMLMNYTSVLEAVSDSMITSMSYDEISELVKMQINDMPSWDIKQYSVDGTGDEQMTYSLSSPNYVMVPNEDTVNQAKEYLKQIHNNQLLTFE